MSLPHLNDSHIVNSADAGDFIRVRCEKCGFRDFAYQFIQVGDIYFCSPECSADYHDENEVEDDEN